MPDFIVNSNSDVVISKAKTLSFQVKEWAGGWGVFVRTEDNEVLFEVDATEEGITTKATDLYQALNA